MGVAVTLQIEEDNNMLADEPHHKRFLSTQRIQLPVGEVVVTANV